MSSDEGGVGTRSWRVRRSRASRAGELRTDTNLAGDFRAVRFGLRATRFGAFFFGATFLAFLAFATTLAFAARRLLLGRLAERRGFRVVFAFFRVVLRPPVFRLAMAESLRNLDSFTISVVRSAAYLKSASPQFY